MSNLLLRVTTSPPHSVFSCNAFAFCLLPSCIAASTDWLQAQLLKLRALRIVHIHHQQQDQSNPDPQAVLDLTGYLSGKAWVAVFSPRCSSMQFVLQSVLTCGHPSDSCGQFGQFTTRQWSAHTHRAWPVLCTAKLRSEGSSFIFSASLVVTFSSILASE